MFCVVENSTGIVMPTETPKGKGKGKSKKRTADESTNLALKDFKIEYSKSSRATCKHCEIKICKVRSCLMIYFCKYNVVKTMVVMVD